MQAHPVLTRYYARESQEPLDRGAVIAIRRDPALYRSSDGSARRVASRTGPPATDTHA